MCCVYAILRMSAYILFVGTLSKIEYILTLGFRV
jgi:hypothetical protein